MPKITPSLWFDTEGEQAAELYVSLFPNSRITHVARYGDAGPRPAGTVMTVSFELDGEAFLAINGGPEFPFTEAVSFQVDCGSQEEVDHYWDGLCAGGTPGRCGWLKDPFGLSWQIVPRRLKELLSSSDREAARRVMEAMLQMDRIDIAGLEAAAAGS